MPSLNEDFEYKILNKGEISMTETKSWFTLKAQLQQIVSHQMKLDLFKNIPYSYKNYGLVAIFFGTVYLHNKSYRRKEKLMTLFL